MKTFDDSIAPFYAFIHAQPDSRTVDNKSWATCIVGDYMSHAMGVLNPDIDVVTETLYYWWKTDIIPNDLFERFNQGEFDTYGEAQEALNELGL